MNSVGGHNVLLNGNNQNLRTPLLFRGKASPSLSPHTSRRGPGSTPTATGTEERLTASQSYLKHPTFGESLYNKFEWDPSKTMAPPHLRRQEYFRHSPSSPFGDKISWNAGKRLTKKCSIRGFDHLEERLPDGIHQAYDIQKVQGLSFSLSIKATEHLPM